ncbi:MAG TPA: hypothetical protein DCG84_02280 [Peptococcaceae bacterium]|nr:hypothetical protein [Peptococcaceae bacterium]
MMIEISGSEDCIDVICAVKYSQSCFANCCIFMWQLAVLLFYNTHLKQSIKQPPLIIQTTYKELKHNHKIMRASDTVVIRLPIRN